MLIWFGEHHSILITLNPQLIVTSLKQPLFPVHVDVDGPYNVHFVHSL